ncbi:ArsR family transcriptional regulator [Sporolactobacillus shoreicorticis]|uniref:ArsR/SmtB family transcription factor n=1 Tax=Sporolactobacillus shoreicorticis TaxID=1923877 RepID=A0ABW5SC94_9BACL|nr:ArsR family transcriptional regulator [Sporolactobacillus shoreicorticis]MCO7127897.1 ArsR family transcriptional regulator [Sporolactobacillus shoreicorticis]
MDLDISIKSKVVFAALDSSVRIQIIQLLSKKKMNVSEIAEAIHLTSPITVMHLNKLEEANIIRSEKRGNQRISSLKVDTINISFPNQLYIPFENWDIEIPIGQFTNYDVTPSCGLAGQSGFIGKVDNPSYFMDPERYEAGMLWFSKGFVEYRVPNYLKTNQSLEMIELSVELSSEFPFSNNRWPSDITVSLDDHEIGTWTSPGDFSDIRGRYTPEWVYNDMNQYGMLKLFRISKHGSFIDGQHAADTLISDIDSTKNSWTLRFEVKDTAKNIGGCTIFGNQFGNHNQGIKGTFYFNDTTTDNDD